MKDMMGWILAGVGVFIVYEKFIKPAQAAGTVDNSVTTQPGTTPTQNATTDGQTNVSSTTTAPPTITVGMFNGNLTQPQMNAMISLDDYASKNGLTDLMYNLDQWNYYYNIATGNQGPAPETMGISPRTAIMGYPSYKNLMLRWFGGVTSLNGIYGRYGFQGVPGLNGLGRIAPANYSMQHPTAMDYRSVGRTVPAATPTGWEKMNKLPS